MGQARLRGNREQRIAQAQEKLLAGKPDKLICNSCGGDVTAVHPVSTRGLRGLEAIWTGLCDCGHTTFAASGDPKSVAAFFDALQAGGGEVLLGSQTRDGKSHDIP
jgi:hypothetical protein